MLTPRQKKWLAHLSDDDEIIIKPYDPKSQTIFEDVKSKVLECLGNEYEVLQRGATNLKISGQNEIDIYIPVEPSAFDATVAKMEESFGKPKSVYPLIRARFRLQEYTEKHIDVFVINSEDSGWVDSEKFTNHLLQNPDDLERYRILKEEGNGMSTREYYTKKTEFINEILQKIG